MALKAPVTVQLIHLLISDSIWITLVLFAAATLTPRDEPAVASPAAATLAGERCAVNLYWILDKDARTWGMW